MAFDLASIYFAQCSLMNLYAHFCVCLNLFLLAFVLLVAAAAASFLLTKLIVFELLFLCLSFVERRRLDFKHLQWRLHQWCCLLVWFSWRITRGAGICWGRHAIIADTFSQSFDVCSAQPFPPPQREFKCEINLWISCTYKFVWCPVHCPVICTVRHFDRNLAFKLNDLMVNLAFE